MATEPGSMMTAADFFGADADGVDKFKAVALRALLDQKTEEELKLLRLEKDKMNKDNIALMKEVAQLKASMEANIDDRERVLAFKSKRIEELLVKVKEYEAINTSLLQTISGSTELTEAGRNTRASMMLLERGHPLFHAVETCKEQEYKRLWEEKRTQCDQLLQQIADNEALVKEMQGFQRQKEDWATQLAATEAVVTKIAAEKDEKIHFLERKLVFEHDRLTKEKDSEIMAHQSDMEKQLTLQLDATTQRTIEENVRVQLELRYQSSQLERLVKQVDALTTESRRANHEKQLVDEMNATLSKKLKFYEHLFAKMQKNDHAKTKSQQVSLDNELNSKSSPSRRKPPLPSLGLRSGVGMQSAFALSATTLARSPSRGRDEQYSMATPLHLDMTSLDLLGDKLNSVASEFDSHLQKREFAQKEVKAMLQYRELSPRFAEPGFTADHATKKRKSKKKGMLSKGGYSPASYPSRGARRLKAAPLTLDEFIQYHATLSPRNRDNNGNQPVRPAIGRSPRLPLLSSNSDPRPPPPRTDVSSLWKAPPPPSSQTSNANQQDTSDQHALTARF